MIILSYGISSLVLGSSVNNTTVMPLFNASVLLLQDITYDAFVEGYIRFRLRVDVSHMMRADLGFCFSAIDMT